MRREEPVAVSRDGGPAFPVERGRSDGMSLRDWFAGQVLAGLAARMDHLTVRKYAGVLSDQAEGREAIAAYALADKMLAERDK